MKTKNLLVVLALIFFGSTIMSFMVNQDKKEAGPWVIPAEYQKKKMPAGTEANQGKMLWAVHCKSCHGNTGLGDGPKAGSLKTIVHSFKTPEFQAQSDGAIYYESFVGRDEMPNFEKKIPDDEDRWNLVAYIRTLK